MKKRILKTLFSVLLVGVWTIGIFSCGTERPLSKVPPQNNSTYKVEYLFEHDGCKVYRFRDNGNYIYFTNCKGNTIAIENDSIGTRTVNHTQIQK